MKTLLTIALTLTLSSAFAQVQSAGSLQGSQTSGVRTGGGTSVPNNANTQRTFGSEQAPAINSDSIGTSQSSTVRGSTPTNNNNSMNRNLNTAPIAPTNTANCVDSSGRSYSASDVGHTACVNSMRTR